MTPTTPGNVTTANNQALARFAAGDAVLRAIMPAAEALPALAHAPALSHAGPPLPYAAMCGPMQGALCGAMIFEGWANSATNAHVALLRGDVRLHSNHEIGAVAPMAGVISPSMAAFVVENPAFGNRVATIINEGVATAVLRCGANAPERDRPVATPEPGSDARAGSCAPLRAVAARRAR